MSDIPTPQFRGDYKGKLLSRSAKTTQSDTRLAYFATESFLIDVYPESKRLVEKGEDVSYLTELDGGFAMLDGYRSHCIDRVYDESGKQIGGALIPKRLIEVKHLCRMRRVETFEFEVV
jgi:hypothetical protein